jgi:hypothetical protein
MDLSEGKLAVEERREINPVPDTKDVSEKREDSFLYLENFHVEVL